MKKRALHSLSSILVIIGAAAACGSEQPSAGTGGSAAAPGSAGGAGSLGLVPGSQVAAGSGAPAANITAGAAGSVPLGSGVPPAAAGSGSTPVTAGTAAPIPTGASDLPCQVSTALAANCQKCHGTTPTFGAPIPLMRHADFMKPSAKDPTTTVAQLALKRINDTASPMPPGGTMVAADRTTLSSWLTAGAKPATAAEAACVPTSGNDSPRTPVVHDEAYFRNGLTPKAGETCYELPVHAAQTPGDKTPYTVRTGEHYEQFYVKIPWGPDTLMTRFGSKFDNLKVVHHWLLFTTNRPLSADGTHETTIGSTAGDGSELLAGWAVGGDHVEFPEDTGLEVPASGILNAQWHYFNQGTAPEKDASLIQICTVPRAMRKNIASLTFLGTENFNGPLGMPAKTMSDFGGTCTNNSGAPITIYGFTPHMHKLGRHMKAQVMRAGTGQLETVFDKPFDFNSQITYILDDLITLQPGDTIISTCTFLNHTDAPVPFGPSTEQEMCYNFTMSYPARKLDNGTLSLIGATNVCW